MRKAANRRSSIHASFWWLDKWKQTLRNFPACAMQLMLPVPLDALLQRRLGGHLVLHVSLLVQAIHPTNDGCPWETTNLNGSLSRDQIHQPTEDNRRSDEEH